MLIKTTEELKEHLPANAAFEFDNLKPRIEDAEEALIIPMLGQAQYDELQNARTRNTYTTALELLLAKVQRPLARYAYYKYIPEAILVFGAGGLGMAANADVKNPPEWMIYKLSESYVQSTDVSMESLLTFLENNKNNYPLWRDSAVRADILNCFITNTTEFNKHFKIGNSRRTYLAMLPVMVRMQRNNILPILGQELYDQIITQIKASNVTDVNTALLNFIKPAVACLTAARATTDLSVRWSTDGLRLTATSDRATLVVKTPAETDRLAEIEKTARMDGETDLKSLTDYLYAHAADYSIWTDSSTSCYVDPTSSAAEAWDQSGNGIVTF